MSISVGSISVGSISVGSISVGSISVGSISVGCISAEYCNKMLDEFIEMIPLTLCDKTRHKQMRPVNNTPDSGLISYNKKGLNVMVSDIISILFSINTI